MNTLNIVYLAAGSVVSVLVCCGLFYAFLRFLRAGVTQADVSALQAIVVIKDQLIGAQAGKIVAQDAKIADLAATSAAQAQQITELQAQVAELQQALGATTIAARRRLKAVPPRSQP